MGHRKFHRRWPFSSCNYLHTTEDDQMTRGSRIYLLLLGLSVLAIAWFSPSTFSLIGEVNEPSRKVVQAIEENCQRQKEPHFFEGEAFGVEICAIRWGIEARLYHRGKIVIVGLYAADGETLIAAWQDQEALIAIFGRERVLNYGVDPTST